MTTSYEATEETDCAKCPKCGWLDIDVQEYFIRDRPHVAVACHHCDAPLLIFRHVEVSYECVIRDVTREPE